VKEEVVSFLKNLKSDDICIVAHKDTDGICSLSLLLYFFKKRNIDSVYTITDIPIKNLNKHKVMIFLDISTDNIKSFSDKTMVIDHHPFSKKPEIPFYNPRELHKDAYIPASYLVYEVCSEIENIDEKKWVSAVGIIGDKGELNSEFCKRYINNFENKDQLKTISDYIFSVDLVDGILGDEKIINALLTQTPEDILKNIYFKYCYNEVQREIENCNKYIEKDRNIIFVKVKSKYNIKSIIASKLLNKYKDVIVVAYSEYSEGYNISVRTNIPEIDIGKITKKAAESVFEIGGGHEKAAGAKIKKENLNRFKENFISFCPH